MRGPNWQVRVQFFEELTSFSLFWEINSGPFLHIMAANSIKLLTGNSHPELAQLVADRYVMHLCTASAQKTYRALIET